MPRPRLRRAPHSSCGAVHQHHHARAGLLDLLQRLADAPGMRALAGVQQIDDRQRLVHAHQRFVLRVDLAQAISARWRAPTARSRYDTRWNLPQGVSISRSAERCTSDSLRLRYSIRSAMVPIFSLCSRGELEQVGQPRHACRRRCMISHSTAAGVEAGEAREVAAGLGVAGAHQHAARLRDQREDVARLHDVLRRCILGQTRP